MDEGMIPEINKLIDELYDYSEKKTTQEDKGGFFHDLKEEFRQSKYKRKYSTLRKLIEIEFGVESKLDVKQKEKLHSLRLYMDTL